MDGGPEMIVRHLRDGFYSMVTDAGRFEVERLRGRGKNKARQWSVLCPQGRKTVHPSLREAKQFVRTYR